MKLISLNTWGGEAGLDGLLGFVRAHSDADLFCFQEIWNGGEEMKDKKGGGSWLDKRVTTLLPELAAAFPDHAYYFRPHFHDYYGLALFVRNGIEVLEEGDLYIYKERGYISPEEYGNHARNLQYVRLNTPRGERVVANLHGLWNGKGKTDCEERLEQSDRIAAFIASRTEPLVIVGDFNLLPETESVARIESAGMRNLIAEYGITSTRTSHYTKPEKFADYAFVRGVEVADFRVLPDEVSDHSPLYLEFS